MFFYSTKFMLFEQALIVADEKDNFSNLAILSGLAFDVNIVYETGLSCMLGEASKWSNPE